MLHGSEINTAAAKSLKLCPTLCDPIDGSPPGSSMHGIFQTKYWRGVSLPSPSLSLDVWNMWCLWDDEIQTQGCPNIRPWWSNLGILSVWQVSKAVTRASLVAQRLKHLPGMREIQVQSLGQEDAQEKEMATHSSTLAWRIPWREEPGRLQSMGSRSRTRLSDFTFTFWGCNSSLYWCRDMWMS